MAADQSVKSCPWKPSARWAMILELDCSRWWLGSDSPERQEGGRSTMTQEGPDLAGPSGEKGPTDYSGPTLRDVVRHMQMAAGCPDPDTENAVTLAQISEVQSVDVVTRVLQEWVRGRLEAYDPGSLMPILTPRMCQNPRIEWNYVAGSIPNLGLGEVFVWGSCRVGCLLTAPFGLRVTGTGAFCCMVPIGL